ADQRYHLVVLASKVAANILSARTHMILQSGASAKKWGRLIVGWGGTGGTAQTQADTSASMRVQLVQLENSPRPEWEMGAAFGALCCTKDPRQELDDLELTWAMPPFAQADLPTDAELEANLDEGVTPLKLVRLGDRVLVTRSVHTLHGAGLNGNFAMDCSIVEKSDYTKESVIAAFSAYKGKTLKSLSPAGRPSTITPDRATTILTGRLQLLDSEDYVQGTKIYSKAGSIVAQVNGVNPDRVDCAYPFHPTRSAHFWAIKETYTF
ncbi:MAG: hypothetical protein ABH877_00755, partial [bacterium]